MSVKKRLIVKSFKKGFSESLSNKGSFIRAMFIITLATKTGAADAKVKILKVTINLFKR
jgi:hypothetical protein